MTDQRKHSSPLAGSEQEQLSKSQREKETGTVSTSQISTQISRALAGVQQKKNKTKKKTQPALPFTIAALDPQTFPRTVLGSETSETQGAASQVWHETYLVVKPDLRLFIVSTNSRPGPLHKY